MMKLFLTILFFVVFNTAQARVLTEPDPDRFLREDFAKILKECLNGIYEAKGDYECESAGASGACEKVYDISSNIYMQYVINAIQECKISHPK